MSEESRQQIEKFFYVYDVITYFHDHEVVNRETGKKLKGFAKSFTASQGFINTIVSTKDLDAIRHGYQAFVTAIETPNTLNTRQAEKFLYDIFPEELNHMEWDIIESTSEHKSLIDIHKHQATRQLKREKKLVNSVLTRFFHVLIDKFQITGNVGGDLPISKDSKLLHSYETRILD